VKNIEIIYEQNLLDVIEKDFKEISHQSLSPKSMDQGSDLEWSSEGEYQKNENESEVEKKYIKEENLE